MGRERSEHRSVLGRPGQRYADVVRLIIRCEATRRRLQANGHVQLEMNFCADADWPAAAPLGDVEQA